MNKKKQVIIISSVAALTITSGLVFLKVSQANGTDFRKGHIIQAFEETKTTDEVGTSDNDSYTYIPPIPVGGNTQEEISSYDAEKEEPFIPATKMDLDPSSITVFVNKEYALPKSYRPEKLVTPNVLFNLITYDERTLMRPEAAEALEKLFEAAKQDGIILYGISGFRSYERQYKIFTNNIVNKGKKYTLRYSAVPGTSEHQTGLAIDVSSESLNFRLTSGFASSQEGIWLAKNAFNYGYIIRYTEDSEKITGYAYEPWHIRYVGKALALYLHDNDMTLEEYYRYTPSPGFDFETQYADMINYTPPVVTKAPVIEDVLVDENGNPISEEIESDLPEDGFEEEDTIDKPDKTTHGDDAKEDTDPLPKDITGAPGDSSSDDEDADGETEPGEEGRQIPEAPTVTPYVTQAPDITPTPLPTPIPSTGISNGEASPTLPADRIINQE